MVNASVEQRSATLSSVQEGFWRPRQGRAEIRCLDGVFGMSQNPYDLLKKEFPELAGKYDSLVESQRALKGLDAKTKQLINIAVQTAIRNPPGGEVPRDDGETGGSVEIGGSGSGCNESSLGGLGGCPGFASFGYRRL